jgi:hypothetical protein
LNHIYEEFFYRKFAYTMYDASFFVERMDFSSISITSVMAEISLPDARKLSHDFITIINGVEMLLLSLL